MMWRPVTVGEVIFKHLFETVGQYTDVENSKHGLGFLLVPERFADYSRLSVTLELFLRTIRCCSETYAQAPNGTAREFGQRLRADTDLPASVVQGTAFREALKHAGRIANDSNSVPKQIEKNVIRDSRNQCYLCGSELVKKPNHHNTATIDHIWPKLLAGESLEDNLLAACLDCNTKKAHAITWAWGPVHQTYEFVTRDLQAPWSVRLSLALARLMSAATAGSRPLTLKQAAPQIRPAVPSPSMAKNRRHLFFEFLSQSEAGA
jgi:hypothetical protein